MGCGGLTCLNEQRRFTRTCNPPACDVETTCSDDSTCCSIACTPWVQQGCIVAPEVYSGCDCTTGGKRKWSRTCPNNCDIETHCLVDATCFAC